MIQREASAPRPRRRASQCVRTRKVLCGDDDATPHSRQGAVPHAAGGAALVWSHDHVGGKSKVVLVRNTSSDLMSICGM